MYRTHKSATCCYCGSKTVLSLSEGVRHELKCSACGAPISKLKSLKENHVEDRFTVGRKKKPSSKPHKKSKAKKKKRKNSIGYHLFELAEDLLDIID